MTVSKFCGVCNGAFMKIDCESLQWLSLLSSLPSSSTSFLLWKLVGKQKGQLSVPPPKHFLGSQFCMHNMFNMQKGHSLIFWSILESKSKNSLVFGLLAQNLGSVEYGTTTWEIERKIYCLTLDRNPLSLTLPVRLLKTKLTLCIYSRTI